MASFVSNQIGLSYPKTRELYAKVIPIARTDSSTLKCVLPKNACIIGLHVYQAVASSTAAATFNLGWSGATTALLNAFSMGTTSVGLVNSGTYTGSGVFSKLTQDQNIICTFTAGSSTAGGTGYVVIEYFVAGSQEQVDD